MHGLTNVPGRRRASPVLNYLVKDDLVATRGDSAQGVEEVAKCDAYRNLLIPAVVAKSLANFTNSSLSCR